VYRATGTCLGTLAVRAIAAKEHVLLQESQKLGCHDGSVLFIAHGAAGCRPDGGTPNAPGCQPGQVHDGSACIPFVRPAQGDGYTVDIATWTRAAFGADGGAGSPELCSRLERDPGVLGVGVGTQAWVHLSLEVVVPDNDLTQLHTRAEGSVEWAAGAEFPSSPALRRPLSPDGNAFMNAVSQSLTDTLRSVGGTSTVASLTTEVRCAIRAGSIPLALTASTNNLP
jgi:hypothetical protein